MNWALLDWTRLAGLRQNFLNPEYIDGPYWSSLEDLDLYDATFGRRIAWKWEAVLTELKARGWSPTGSSLLDWGCGSAVASEVFMNNFSVLASALASKVSGADLQLWDYSDLAIEYSIKKMSSKGASVRKKDSEGISSVDVLLISHVLNELSAESLAHLKKQIKQARQVVWVESGGMEVSRNLSRIRDELLSSGAFRVVAPCTHAASCGMLVEPNAHNWCHSFAFAPPEVHQSSDWSLFSERMKIDLRRVAYSFLVLERVEAGASTEVSTSARVIGEARFYKGYAKLLACTEDLGVSELILQKRNSAEAFKILGKKRYPLLWDLEHAQGKITRMSPASTIG